jgi:hypothetical protein
VIRYAVQRYPKCEFGRQRLRSSCHEFTVWMFASAVPHLVPLRSLVTDSTLHGAEQYRRVPSCGSLTVRTETPDWYCK